MLFRSRAISAEDFRLFLENAAINQAAGVRGVGYVWCTGSVCCCACHSSFCNGSAQAEDSQYMDFKRVDLGMQCSDSVLWTSGSSAVLFRRRDPCFMVIFSVLFSNAGPGRYQIIVCTGRTAGIPRSNLSDSLIFFLWRNPVFRIAYRQRNDRVPFPIFCQLFQNVFKRSETQAILSNRQTGGKFSFYPAYFTGVVSICRRRLLKKSILAICDVEIGRASCRERV